VIFSGCSLKPGSRCIYIQFKVTACKRLLKASSRCICARITLLSCSTPVVAFKVSALSCFYRARPHLRTNFSNLPGVTSIPTGVDERTTDRKPLQPRSGRRTPPLPLSAVAAEPVVAPPIAAVHPTNRAATAADSINERLGNVDSRLAVTEKSMRALVYEVVRLQVNVHTSAS
jgi:hypothetical protein